MLRVRLVCAIVLFGATTAGAASRLTFERVVPPPRPLGKVEDVLITFAISDNDTISTFIDAFIDQTSREGTLRVIDPTVFEHSMERSRRWRRPPKFVPGRYRADAYLRIDSFRCNTTERSGQGGSHDVNGNRVHGTQQWIDAICVAHIDVLAKDQKAKIAEFSVGGEGTSPRVAQVSAEERQNATEQAARYAAVAAAEQITPRHVRESITLAENAPRFAEAMSSIDRQDLGNARRIWETALSAYPDSAPLQFDLAAVCEALGDYPAAAHHYAEAERLAPKETRYRDGFGSFRQRAGWKK